MKPWFENEKRAKRLREYLHEWIGTPYRHLGKTKGRAVDCSFFIGDTMARMKIVKKLDREEYYASDWYLHSEDEKLLNGFLENKKYLPDNMTYIELTDEEPMVGDFVFIRLFDRGKISHMGIFVEKDKFIHGILNYGVQYSTYGVYWKNKTVKRYRLMEWESG